MKASSEAPRESGALALYSRRKFLKRALLTAAYVTPVLVSYPSTVFATHCGMGMTSTCGGAMHNMGGQWSPGCSTL